MNYLIYLYIVEKLTIMTITILPKVNFKHVQNPKYRVQYRYLLTCQCIFDCYSSV